MRLGMGFGVGLVAALGIAGCSNEPGDTEAKDRADAEAVAQVIAQLRAANYRFVTLFEAAQAQRSEG